MTLQTLWESNGLIIFLAVLSYYFLEFKSGNVSPFSGGYWIKDNILNLLFTIICVTLWYLVLGTPTKLGALALGLCPNLAVDWIVDLKKKYSK